MYNRSFDRRGNSPQLAVAIGLDEGRKDRCRTMMGGNVEALPNQTPDTYYPMVEWLIDKVASCDNNDDIV
jgi:hypothetical protein